MCLSSMPRSWFAAITVPRYLLHTLEWTGGCSENPARARHSQGEHHSAWDSITPSAWDKLHKAEVTRTGGSELAPSSRSLCCRLCRDPPAEEPKLAAGREKHKALVESSSLGMFIKRAGVVLRDVVQWWSWQCSSGLMVGLNAPGGL